MGANFPKAARAGAASTSIATNLSIDPVQTSEFENTSSETKRASHNDDAVQHDTHNPAPRYRSFDAALSAARETIDARLDSLFQKTREPARLTCAIRHGLLSPGKRLRPLITTFAGEQFGAPLSVTIDAACAVEMVHAASLIMDDLPAMDDARMRRGNVATHVVFGEGTGMLATIALLNEAFRLVGQTPGASSDRRLRALNHLTAAIGPDGLAGGQEKDIACDGAENCMTDMEHRHHQKTGALFSAAAAMGAELAEADAQSIHAMIEYGRALGLAYQAFDDVLDCSASENDIGKDVMQDEGKSTVVTILGKEGARAQCRRWLNRAREIAETVGVGGPSAPLALFVGKLDRKFAVKIGEFA
ncbi:MAG: polyprenyl synthetase family protein [Pseudomonadota bacterium]